MNTIIVGGVGQDQLIEAPRENVERLARWLNKHGAKILIDPNMDQKSLASRVYWNMDDHPWTRAGMY